MRSMVALIALLLPLSVAADMREGLEAASRGDYAEALRQFKPIAEQGDAEAQHFLGVIYRYGRGVKIDHTEAAKWFRMSAEQGNPEAQFYMGLSYQNGEGVPRDPVAAHMWFTLSARNPKTGLRDAAYRERDARRLEEKMSPEQIAKAKQMAQDWKPKN